MSINVHVTGNPISIKRGKMVTAELDQCKKEFDKRRLMRLEQVRQQSKDIAEGLRNKVKKERKSQMKEIEEEGKRKLMNWQNRKLLELQTQYQEALKELGVAHKSAQVVDEADAFLLEEELLNQEKATQRGKTAGSKFHRDKFKEELDKARLNDRKKLVREIENARAQMVSTVPRRSKVNRKRRSHRDTSISVSDSEDEFEDYDESDSESNELSDIKVTNEVESSSCSCAASSEVSWPAGEISKNKNRAGGSETLKGTADFQKKKRYLAANHVEEVPPDSVPPLHLVSDDSLSDYQLSKKPQVTSRKKYSSRPVAIEKTRQASPTKIRPVSPKKTVPNSTVSPKKTRSVSPKKTGLGSPEKSKPLSPRASQSQLSSFEKAQQAYDTRISDRIRHRGVICDEEREIKTTEPVQIPLVESRTDIRDFINSRRCHEDCLCCCGRRGYKKNSESDGVMENHGTQTIDNKLTQTSMKSQSIPSHPSVKLKSTEIESRQSQLLKENKKSHSPAKRQKKTVSPSKGDKKAKSPIKMASKIDRTSRLASENSFPSGSKIHINPDSPSKMGSRVHVYDHPNRFSTEKIVPPNSFVEKIPVESLEFLSDPSSEGEKLEAVSKRERDAQIRGRKALEKERLRREYEEMLKKLPMLQKKERICEIYNDKPEYHMSEERLKEKERARQNNLENHYNRLFPNIKPAIVTLPKVNQTKEENSSEESSVYSLNVAEWDVDYKVPSKFSSQEIQNIIKEFIKIKPYDRRAKLKELLKNLKIQRDQLLSAFSALPKNDSLDELIKDLRSLDDPNVKRSKPTKSDRKRRKENDADTSIDSSQESSAKDVEGAAKEAPRKSPRKKAKTKTRPNVIILQNTSTQTTPKPVKGENQKPECVTTDSKLKDNICNKYHIPCDCNKENEDVTDDLCHIFIKLNEDDSPEVMVKAKDKEKTVKPVLSKHVTVGTQISPEAKKVHRKPRTRPRVSETTPSNEKSRTWKDQFSKNSISTTSTSYYSPPEFQKTKTSDQSSFYNLRSKPQQEELSSAFNSTKHHSTESLDLPSDPLKPFIKKLLSMSKVSIHDLSVSSSTVETPSQSIIEMESNVPKQNLRQMIDSFKSKIGGIAEGLSYTPDISPVPFNLSISSENSSISHKETTIPTEKPSTSLESKEELVNQYAKVSDSVTKRIQALAKMIETLREEKVKILQSSKTKSFQDKDFSTSYMDLPDSKSGSTSKSSSLEEDEILKKLMEIDQSVLDRMGVRRQHLSKDEIDQSKDSNSKSRNTPSINATNKEFAERLQRLKTQETSFIPSKQSAFVPFLSDIPKLPKFEPQPDTGQLHKRPPPSKGLTVAKKFNGNISLVPHELSTIVEADSQMSTKLPSPETSEVNMNIPPLTVPDVRLETGSGKSKKSSKETSKSSSNGNKDQSTSNKDDNSKSSGDIFLSLLSSSSSGSKKKCDDSTCGAINLQHFSSSSSDDIETVEAMLRSIGMEWAIPTLYKTQEALALGSSSSSLDLSKKRSRSEDLSTNEINLRDYLKKHVLGKVSSSTMLSDTTLPPSFVGEYSELSGIQVGNSSVDKSKQRTSTPINLSKSTSHSKAVFTDSDLSSIKPDTSKSKRKS